MINETNNQGNQMNNSNEKLAYSLNAACAILDGRGLSEEEIINYVKNAYQPTPGYIYLDNN